MDQDLFEKKQFKLNCKSKILLIGNNQLKISMVINKITHDIASMCYKVTSQIKEIEFTNSSKLIDSIDSYISKDDSDDIEHLICVCGIEQLKMFDKTDIQKFDYVMITDCKTDDETLHMIWEKCFNKFQSEDFFLYMLHLYTQGNKCIAYKNDIELNLEESVSYFQGPSYHYESNFNGDCFTLSAVMDFIL